MYRHRVNRTVAGSHNRLRDWNRHGFFAVSRGALPQNPCEREEGDDIDDNIAKHRERSLKATLVTFALGLTSLLILIALLAAFDWR